MAKIDALTDLASLQSETTAIEAINSNNDKITEALENTLSRDGSAPNSMGADLDLNGNRILNLPEPVDDTEPVRKVDLGGLTDVDFDAVAQAAEDAVDAAAAAAASAVEAASYVGAALSAPKWTIARTITLTGDVTAVSSPWDGSVNLSFSVNIQPDTITDTELATGAAVANIGYTPANKAGDAFTGAVSFSALPTYSSRKLGYLDMTPHDFTVGFDLGLDNNGRAIRHLSATPHGVGIYGDGTVPWPDGATIPIIVPPGMGAVSMLPNVGVTLTWGGVGSTGSRTVAAGSVATIIRVAANSWIIQGAGIS